ncbi:MAG: uncharacterized protein JWM94_27 [Sphingomonas bacterium]|nr:uncharacterized protein [Sphingomonas bacterium]
MSERAGRYVFALLHTYELDGEDEQKSCGLFETEELAEEAKQKLLMQPGFRRYPDGFLIERTRLNEAWWTEGFSTQLPDGEWVEDPD